MGQKIVLCLIEGVRLVCDWRAFFSSAFRDICIIHQQVFCLWQISARNLVTYRLLFQQISVEMQSLLDVGRGCLMGSSEQDQHELEPGMVRTI